MNPHQTYSGTLPACLLTAALSIAAATLPPHLATPCAATAALLAAVAGALHWRCVKSCADNSRVAAIESRLTKTQMEADMLRERLQKERDVALRSSAALGLAIMNDAASGKRVLEDVRVGAMSSVKGALRYKRLVALDCNAATDAACATKAMALANTKRDVGALCTKGYAKWLADFQKLGQVAQQAHPTWDHFLPLLHAAGSVDPKEPMRFFNANFQSASISMRSVVWG